jgi:hypothetical protein
MVRSGRMAMPLSAIVERERANKLEDIFCCH